MSKQIRKVENNIKYVREQIERFMKYEYGVTYQIEVYGNRRIEREGYFSRVEFIQGRPVAIDISYQLLNKGSREQILKAGLREAIKVVFWYKRIPYTETSDRYNQELLRYKLPVYGSQRQTGQYKHVYGCVKCKKIYVMRDRELPEKRDITTKNILTKCCKEKFEYQGRIFYKGEGLFKIERYLKRNVRDGV